MSSVLLDTNVISFLIKGDSRSTLYAPHLLNNELMLSIITIAELFQWAAMRSWSSSRIQQLEAQFVQYTILPIDMKTGRIWGEIRAKRSAIGQPLSPQDAWIAATAINYNVPLVTHNPKDFKQISGLTVITEAIS